MLFLSTHVMSEHYTLSLHDALPIWMWGFAPNGVHGRNTLSAIAIRAMHRSSGDNHEHGRRAGHHQSQDRKSTRLNSSHVRISYAVFCLKKKNKLQSIISCSIQTIKD